jgi:hypothetical protein
MIKASIAATADEDESEQSLEDDDEEDDVSFFTYSRMKRWKWTKL